MKLEDILGRLQEVARAVIRRDFRADSCIGSTRTVTRVLEHFGISAKPLPVQVYIYNKSYVDAVERGDWPPTFDQVMFRHWCDRNGAWAIGVGVWDEAEGLKPGQYGGHLVAFLPKHHLLIDASLDQAVRPQRGIVLPDVLQIPTTAEFEEGAASLSGVVNNCVLRYHQHNDEGRYLRSPDWADPKRTRKATEDILRYIRQTTTAQSAD